MMPIPRRGIQGQGFLGTSVPPFPTLPKTVTDRFPELVAWENKVKDWVRLNNIAMEANFQKSTKVNPPT